MRNTQEMSGDRSCDGARHLPEDFPLQDYLGTQSDSSERESYTSENDSYLIPSQVAYFHEKRAADRETPDATTSSHKPGGMDIHVDRNEDITMEYDEMINQSSQLHATGSNQNDPSCSLTEEKRFLCHVCSKGFYFKSRLSRHMIIHGREKAPSKKPHQCMVCDLKFSRVDEFSRHIRSHTGSYTGEMPYKCSFCQKSLSTSGHLSRHIKVHTGEKPYECSFCKKTFSQTHHLSRHIKIHTGERPFECSVCGKTFSERGYLTEHQKVHSEERSYVCSICEKRFTSNSYCKRHMRIHTGEKPFPCSICDKSFREKSTHTKHMTTHSGEKPHVCLICNKAFSQRRTLLRHKTIHTKETNIEKS
ncbi:zinc finger protein 501-like [Strongylocentrotus purpuratus]|uniref:C2H2-type domain-containing protein n=1 Tax=Strongylocentrotus purpuratus TaxID=7668 RepID=A0A7M7NBK3_STRPU|nr:zinc finger protein 501-like [Strongylocentrotus purpuratus]